MKLKFAKKFFLFLLFGTLAVNLCFATDQPDVSVNGGLEYNSKVVQYWVGAKENVKRAHDSNVDALRSRFWKVLDDAATPNAALNIATHPKSPEELSASLDWIYWKIFTQNADSRFSISYADLLANVSSNMQMQQQAMIFFINAQLATRIDGARCEDATSGEAVVTMFQNRQSLAKLSDAYRHLDSAHRGEIKLHALAIERMRGPRDVQEWICQYGVAATRWGMAQGAVSNSSAPNDVGTKTINVNTNGYQPQFISDEKWTAKRLEIMDQSLVAIKSLMSPAITNTAKDK
jgi:hypothetical protein